MVGALPRWVRLLSGKPVTESWWIMLLREKGPALWSTTKRSSVEPGCGTALYTGIQYIPGSRDVPSDAEKRPCCCSTSSCPLKKLLVSELRVRLACADSSCVTGKVGWRVFAHGQKPSHSPVQTDSHDVHFLRPLFRTLNLSKLSLILI